MKKSFLRVVVLCISCSFLNACVSYNVVQLFQATSVIDGFYSALNQGEMDLAVDFYADELKQSIGSELLKEGLMADAARLGAFVDYKVRRWSLEQGQNKQRQLVLICEVVYELGRRQELFVVSVGGREKIMSHEIKKEWRTGGAFDI